MLRTQTQTRELTNQDLQTLAPSIFATEPYKTVSERYRFIPTIDVVNGMREKGLIPVKANQSRCRLPDKKEFTKHLIRFRQTKDLEAGIDQEVFEVVLINSHDRTSSYQLMLGIYRLVCSNGLIVGDTFSKIKTIHSGNKDLCKDVIDASFEVIENVPMVENKINTWKEISLDKPIQEIFAKSAIELNPSTLQVEPSRLLQPRRMIDKPSENGQRNLWQTFNVVQENLIKGGIYGKDKNSRYRKARAVKAISADVKLNKALWTLTEAMEKHLNSIQK